MSVLQDAAGRARLAAARGQLNLSWMPAQMPVTRSVLTSRAPSSRLGGLTVPAALDAPVPPSIARALAAVEDRDGR